MAVYKLVEWESETGYHCGDTSKLSKNSNAWWHPARIMGISPAEFLNWLIENHYPDYIYHNADCSFVGWSWKSLAAARKYKNYINKLARERNYQI